MSSCDVAKCVSSCVISYLGELYLIISRIASKKWRDKIIRLLNMNSIKHSYLLKVSPVLIKLH